MSLAEELTQAARIMGHDYGRFADGPCDLSGEWGGVPNGPQVFAAIVREALPTRHGKYGPDYPAEIVDLFTETLDAYETAFNAARDRQELRDTMVYGIDPPWKVVED